MSSARFEGKTIAVLGPRLCSGIRFAVSWVGYSLGGRTMSAYDKKDEMRRGQAVSPAEDMPKQGDHYRCQSCGMEFEVVVSCGCDDPQQVRLECCDRPMARV